MPDIVLHNEMGKRVYERLNEAKRKYKARIFFYFKDEKIVREYK